MSACKISEISVIRRVYILIRAVLRFLMFVAIVNCYFATAILATLITLNPIKRRARLVKNCQFYSKLILKAFNIELTINQIIPEDEVSLVVGNHLGFIDIVCLQSVCPSVFITSLEMKNTPGLGQITDLAGCAYVNRKNRMNIQEELKGITNVLGVGHRVVLYAESVASNGEQVLPFKKTLLMSAGFAKKPIRPFVFNYRQVNHGPVFFEHRDSVCWYGDQTFFPAIWRSLQLDSVTCEIEFLPLVYPTVETDRTELSKSLQQQVASKFYPFYIGMNNESALRQPVTQSQLM